MADQHGTGLSLQPVAPRERIAFIDTLRGFALLGILMPNMLFFSWPFDVQTGLISLPETPESRAAMWVHDVAFLGKFMFLFSMLFGAGVLIWDRKTEGRPLASGAGRWYARCGWLLLFGLAHGFGVWFGDILVTYALAGVGAVWWCRRLPWGVNVGLGLGAYVFGLLAMLALTALSSALSGAEGAEASMAGLSREAQIEAYRGSYLDALMMRLTMMPVFYVLYLPFIMVPMATGMMLIGMGLARQGFLLGRCSTRAYAVVAAAGLLIGPGASVAARLFDESGAAPFTVYPILSQFIGMPTGLAYAAILALVVRAGASNGLARAVSGGLANIGRMALSNYLAHSLIATTIFYGHGLGRFATIGFPRLWLVIAAIWVFNFAFSALWLRWFRVGPFEWLWRTLTYLRPQPLRRPRAA